MILQLYNKQIIIKDNKSPESIDNAKVSYIFELGTNHLTPILYCFDTKVGVGDNISVSFNYTAPELELYVDLVDSKGRVVHSYEGTFKLYRTFTLGTQEHINVYEELTKAREQIKYLEEKGDII